MSNNLLKACPFCGDERLRVVAMSTEDWGDGYQVECLTCHATGPQSMYSTVAENEWNNRCWNTRSKEAENE